MSYFKLQKTLHNARSCNAISYLAVSACFCLTFGEIGPVFRMVSLHADPARLQHDSKTANMLHSGPSITGGRDIIDPSAHSEQVALPWRRQDWCTISPCLTVSNITQRALDLPAYEKWLEREQGRWRMPFAPLIHRSHGLHWLAPDFGANATFYVRNTSHGFKFKTHVAPLPYGSPCDYWISTTGTVLLWFNVYMNDYSHWIHDNAAAIVSLLDLFAFENPWLALPIGELPNKWLSWLNPRIRDRVIFYPSNRVVCSNSSILLPLNFQADGDYGWVSPTPMVLLNQKAHQLHRKASNQPIVVFASRNSSTVAHGRKLVNEHEVLLKIRALMHEYGRPERLVVYNGENVSYAEQFDIFSSATVIIGPHGSALANIIWSSSSPGCSKPVHVVEFVGGASSHHVQGPIYRGYYVHEASVPWVVYHMATFTADSTRDETYVDVNDVDHILRLIWSDAKLLRSSAATKCFFAL